MAIDPNQGIATTPPPVVQTAPDLTGLLVAQLAPIAQQAAQQAVQDVQARMSAVEATVAAQLPALEAKIGVAAAPAVTSILTNVESDPTTQRIVVCATLAAALAGALIILVAALLGNSQAQHWIAAAPALLGAAVLWISKAGVSLPGTPAPKPSN